MVQRLIQQKRERTEMILWSCHENDVESEILMVDFKNKRLIGKCSSNLDSFTEQLPLRITSKKQVKKAA